MEEQGEGMQLEVANMLEIMTSRMEKTCFKRCIQKPGMKLDKNEQVCLAKCMDRFMDSWDVTSKILMAVAQKQQESEELK
jgi:import inner membrane translocase subunit TIM13